MNRTRTHFIFAFSISVCLSLCVKYIYLSLWADVLFSEKRSSVCYFTRWFSSSLCFWIRKFWHTFHTLLDAFKYLRCALFIFLLVAPISLVTFGFTFELHHTKSHETQSDVDRCPANVSQSKFVIGTIIHSMAFALFLFLLSLWISLIWQFHRCSAVIRTDDRVELSRTKSAIYFHRDLVSLYRNTVHESKRWQAQTWTASST